MMIMDDITILTWEINIIYTEAMTTNWKSDGFADQRLLVFNEKSLGEIAHNPLLEPLHVTDIGCFPNARFHYRDRPGGCQSHILIMCLEGEGWVETPFSQRTIMKSPSWLLIPKNTPHTYGSETLRPWTIYWLHFRGNFADSLVQHITSDEHLICASPIREEIIIELVSLFDNAYSMLERGFALNHIILAEQAISYLLTLLCFSGQVGLNKAQNELVVNHAISMMQSRLHGQLTLNELAEQSGLSKSHFVFLFKKVTQKSPIDYFLHLKIQKACQLLTLSNWNIQQIAESLGFNDPYYFSRLFHKMVGQSPNKYRLNKKG
jgi:AraC-like DNA-binding protein